jgi:hypothetical protein
MHSMHVDRKLTGSHEEDCYFDQHCPKRRVQDHRPCFQVDAGCELFDDIQPEQENYTDLQWQDIVGGNKTAGANGNGDAAKEESKEETETKGESAPAPEMSAADPAVNGTGEGEASGEKVEADSKMDQEPVPAE